MNAHPYWGMNEGGRWSTEFSGHCLSILMENAVMESTAFLRTTRREAFHVSPMFGT